MAAYPEINGSYVITKDNKVMTGFTSFDDARAHAVAILSNKESFEANHDIADVKIDRKGTHATFLCTDRTIYPLTLRKIQSRLKAIDI